MSRHLPSAAAAFLASASWAFLAAAESLIANVSERFHHSAEIHGILTIGSSLLLSLGSFVLTKHRDVSTSVVRLAYLEMQQTYLQRQPSSWPLAQQHA